MCTLLRKMAKSFCAETDEVKVQVLNLAVKLCLTNPKQTKLLTQGWNLTKNVSLRTADLLRRASQPPPPFDRKVVSFITITTLVLYRICISVAVPEPQLGYIFAL